MIRAQSRQLFAYRRANTHRARLRARVKAGHPCALLVAAEFVCLVLLASVASAAQVDPTRLPAPMARDVDFARDIQPLLERSCLKCHGPEKQKSGLRLDNPQSALAGGEHGRDILPGESAKSPLIHYVARVVEDMEMPPKGKGEPLTPAEVGLLRAWIDQGAHWPVSNEQAAKPRDGDRTDWWSLKPLQRPPAPSTQRKTSQGANPIDAFVGAKLEQLGLRPSPPASRRVLIRRLFFDLTGLPPRPEEVEAFIHDPDPFAYEKLVDQLLASPRYGERWARHWLDVVHYGETHGYDKDKPRPNAWPYRDYVIRSLNEDKPYSRFVQEQVAGDALFPNTRDGIEALGFLAAGPWDLIGHEEVPETKIDGKIARHLDRDDMVANTIQTFNSFTVQCAQCHNHKFDPILSEEYYGLQAVFAALDRTNKKYDVDPAVARERARLEEKLKEIQARKKELDERITSRAGARLEELDHRIALLEKTPSQSDAFGYHSATANVQDAPKWVQVDLGRAVALSRIELHPCKDDFLVYTSPLYSEDVLVVMGGFMGSSLAVRPGGSGDVTQTRRLWHIPKTRQHIGSGVISGAHIYILNDTGIAECIELATGKVVWEERLKGQGAKSDSWSSMVLCGERIYVSNQSGDVFVLRASPKFELLAANALGETIMSSPAVSDGEIFLRTHRALWCIGEKKSP